MPKFLNNGIPQQKNHLTQQAYKGENQRLLQKAKLNGKFKSDDWLTFNQAKAANLFVKGGESGCQIMRIIENVDTDPDTRKTVIQRGLRKYTVFNLDQCAPQAVATVTAGPMLSSGQRSVIALGGPR